MERQLTGLVNRRLTQVALDRFEDEPVLLLQGPRSVGKSTLLRQLADRIGAAVVDLDDVATRDAVAADPATFVARPGVVCIDEYQHVPLVLDAIKAELNRDGRHLAVLDQFLERVHVMRPDHLGLDEVGYRALVSDVRGWRAHIREVLGRERGIDRRVLATSLAYSRLGRDQAASATLRT